MADPATVAAGAYIAHEVVSTGAQVGVAGYAIAKPTMPLEANFIQIATSRDDQTRYIYP
jgi:hypothetical protein